VKGIQSLENKKSIDENYMEETSYEDSKYQRETDTIRID
jgi:hypothetical protein